jgi:predicted Zn-dependent peptidase
MCFKGTKTRSTKQVADDILKYGGYLNAFTDFEITAYVCKIANTYKTQAINSMLDMVNNCIIPQKEVDKEREVVLQEFKMYEDNIPEKTWELFYKTLYLKKCPLYYSVLGSPETLHKTNRKELINYKKETYNPLTLIVVGDIKDSVNIKEKVYNPVYINKDDIKSGECFEYKKGLNQTNLILGYAKSLPINLTSLYFVADLFKSILDDMNGRLFTVIREQNNLVYRIRFDTNIYNCGLFQWNVTLGLDKNKISKARKLIIQELTRPFTKIEIQKAIIKSIGSLELHLNNYSITHIIAYNILKEIDWKKIIYNYKEEYYKAAKIITQIQKNINFNENLTIGIVPK